MLEKVIADVINKLMGDYFENVNRSQLKIALWSGDVRLTSLKLRDTVLDDTYLPLRVVYGYLGKLVLKIPWKKIYSQHVVVNAEDLFIVVTKKKLKPYDAEYEAKKEYDKKMSKLLDYEDILREKGLPDLPTFKEKLAALIIRNLQIKITNVHISYEDPVSSTDPVVWGISLYNLEISTADSNWNKRYVTDKMPISYKLCKLEGLSGYLNCKPETSSKHREPVELLTLLKQTIATKSFRPKNFHYFLGPTSTKIKLKLNITPEHDRPAFTVPKCTVIAEETLLEVNFTPSQYKYILDFFDRWWRNSLGAPYRKFRPFNLPYHRHARRWWRFALNAVLDFVHRKALAWSWSHIKEHRRIYRAYAEAYKLRELSKNPSATLVAKCRLLEERLDLNNLIYIRQQVRLELTKLHSHLQSSKSTRGQSIWSGIFNRATSIDENEKVHDMIRKVKTELTKADKEKFYESIGYRVGNRPGEMPHRYVSLSISANLEQARLTLYDDSPQTKRKTKKDRIDVACLRILNVKGKCNYRSSANGLYLKLTIGGLDMTGMEQEGVFRVPTIIRYTFDESLNLLDFEYEHHPLDKHCDHKIHITARTLYLIYDYRTVLHIFNVFDPLDFLRHFQGEELRLVEPKYGDHSASVLWMIADQKLTFDVLVHVMANLILIPKDGYYMQRRSSLVIISLGDLWIKLSPRPRLDLPSINKMMESKPGSTQYEKFLKAAYNRISINLHEMQLLVAHPDENWRSALTKKPFTDMHLLRPVSINSELSLCTLQELNRLPNCKMDIEVLSLPINICVDRLLETIKIITSFPLPLVDVPLDVPKSDLPGTSKYQRKNSPKASKQKRATSFQGKRNKMTASMFINAANAAALTQILNNFEGQFVLKFFDIEVYHYLSRDELKSNYKIADLRKVTHKVKQDQVLKNPGTQSLQHLAAQKANAKGLEQVKVLILSISMPSLSVRILQSPERLIARVLIDSLQIAQFECTDSKRAKFVILNTIIPGKKSHLFFMEYIFADTESPSFKRRFHSVQHKLRMRLAYVGFTFNLECLLELLMLVDHVQEKLINIINKASYNHKNWKREYLKMDRLRAPMLLQRATAFFGAGPQGTMADIAIRAKEFTQFKFLIDITQLEVSLTTRRRPFAKIKMEQLSGQLSQRLKATEMRGALTNIEIIDMNPATVHRNILTTLGDEALYFAIAVYHVGSDKTQMRNDDARIVMVLLPLQIVYMHWFFQNVMVFASHFQVPIQMLTTAYAVASDAAVAAYDDAKRINLKIDIRAPVILVPIDSNNYEALEIDLGLISVSNKVVSFNVRDHGLVWVDTIKIEFKNLTVKNVNMEEDFFSASSQMKDPVPPSKAAEPEVQVKNILDPMNCLFTVTRNLSKKTYKFIPAVDVTGTFKLIEFNLLKNDFLVMRLIVSNNFREGANDILKTYRIKLMPKNQAKAVEHAVRRFKLLREDVDNKTEEIHIFFEMDGVIANFMYDQKQTLSRFAVYLVSLKVSQFSNGRKNINVVVCNLEVQDTRSGSKNIIRQYISRKDWVMFDKKHLTTAIDYLRKCREDTDAMFKIQISIKNKLTLVEANVIGLDFIVNVEFFSEILRFCRVATAKPERRDALATKINEVDFAAASRYQMDHSYSKPERAQGVVKVVTNVDKFDVFFVESLENINTNCIICSVIATSSADSKKEGIDVTCSIRDLCMHMCVFNPKKRYSTTHFILRPCHIDIEGHIDVKDHINRIFVHMDDVRMNLSPPSISLIHKTIVGLSAGEVPKSAAEEVKGDYTTLWRPKEFKRRDYWFLKHINHNDDDNELNPSLLSLSMENEATGDLSIEINSITIVLEDGLGYYTTPFIQAYFTLKGKLLTWTNDKRAEGQLKMNVDYYNALNGVWEPVIEKIEHIQPSGMALHIPWELHYHAIIQDRPDDLTYNFYKRSYVELKAEKNMEITLSRTFIELALRLATSFTKAVQPSMAKPKLIAPYRVQNSTGLKVILNFAVGNITLHEVYFMRSSMAQEFAKNVSIRYDAANELECLMAPNSMVFLTYKHLSTVLRDEEAYVISVKIENSKSFVDIPIYIIAERHHRVRMADNDHYDFISEIVNEYGTMSIKLYSVVNIVNNCCRTIEVYQSDETETSEKNLLLKVRPNSRKHLPLKAIYRKHNELYFTAENFSHTNESFGFFEHQQLEEHTKLLKCIDNTTNEPFFIYAIRLSRLVLTNRPRERAPVFNIVLRPLITLRNALPFNIRVSMAGISVHTKAMKREPRAENTSKVPKERLSSVMHKGPVEAMELVGYGEKEIEPSGLIQLPSLTYSNRGIADKTFLVVKLLKYLEHDWSCTTDIQHRKHTAMWNFSTYDNNTTHQIDMDLFALYDDEHGSINITLYSPIWMINKTSLLLTYSTEAHMHSTYVKTLYHPPEYEGPILFSFTPTFLKRHKYAYVRVGNGDKSAKVPLDAVGSMGSIICYENAKMYKIGVHNHMRGGSLTKKIVFIPFYLAINRLDFKLKMKIFGTKKEQTEVLTLKPHSDVSIWPSKQSQHKMLLKIGDFSSVPFKFSEENDVLLKLEGHPLGGIYVSIRVTDGGTSLLFTPYQLGNAPALIINATAHSIDFHQFGFANTTVKPGDQVLYTWTDPTRNRYLVFGKNKAWVTLDHNCDGEVYHDRTTLSYWSTFLHGQQRVLLFTDIKEYSTNHERLTLLQRKAAKNFEIKLNGIGISLVNNREPAEVAYFGITHSGIIWEYRKLNQKRLRKLSKAVEVEAAFHNYSPRRSRLDPHIAKYKISKNAVVDFHNMVLTKKKKKYVLKRTFQPGVWISCSFTEFFRQIHIKLQHVQVDNQLKDPVFPVALAPVKLPKSIVLSAVPKPFVEFMVIEHTLPNTNIKHFQHIGLLIQEFYCNLSVRFVAALFEIMVIKPKEEDQQLDWLLHDLHTLDKHVTDFVKIGRVENLDYFHYIHLSPIKMHFSFTVENTSAKPMFGLFTVLYSVGIALTNVDDIVFRLAYFQTEHITMDRTELLNKILDYYKSQALKQFYVYVLGLDVLGNPYGLIFGMKKGVQDLFYEPFKGAVQGPNEFVEGIYYGFKSLFSQTIGGCAGALKRITGSIARGFAFLTFDEDYARKRRKLKQMGGIHFTERLIRSTRALAMTFVDGVCCVVLMPYNGAREDKCRGFTIGLCKGLLGLVARPASGICDFLSNNFEAIKRLVSNRDDGNLLRAPRFIHYDGVLRVYCTEYANGVRVLTEIHSGKLAKEEMFIHCEFLTPQELIILTDQRIIYVKLNKVLQHWIVRWNYLWDNIDGVSSNALAIQLNVHKKKLMKYEKLVVVIPLENSFRRERLTHYCEAEKRGGVYSSATRLRLRRHTKYGTYY